MKRIGHNPEQVIRKLRTADQLLNQALTIADVGFPRFSGRRSRVQKDECTDRDEPLLVDDRSDVTDR